MKLFKRQVVWLIQESAGNPSYLISKVIERINPNHQKNLLSINFWRARYE
jgi:hypothetical protein